MCVLIAINQLGFGGVVPVLALYAQSFGVTPDGDRARHRRLRPRAVPDRGARRPARRPVRPARRARARRARAGGRQSPLRVRADYPAFVGARFVAGAGAALVLTAGQIVLADITTPARARARHGDLSGQLPVRGRHRPASRAGCWPSASAWRPRSSPMRSRALLAAAGRVAPASRRRAPIPGAADVDRRAALPPFAAQIRILTGRRRLRARQPVSFTNAVARTGALFSVIPVLARDRLRADPPTASASAWRSASLVGLGARLPRRHAGGPLRPEGGDRAGDAHVRRLAGAVPARPVLCVVPGRRASRGASPRA